MEEKGFGDCYGEFRKTDKVNVKIHVSQFKGVWRVDIREFIKDKNYEGPLKKGITLRMDSLSELKSCLDKIDPSRYVDETTTQ